MKRNYLLFMPSLMREGCEPVAYKAEGTQQTFEGLQTNIPATKYIVSSLAQKGEKLSKIIMLCSDEVLKQEIRPSGRETAVRTYEYYTETISEWMRRHGYGEAQLDGMFVSYPLNDVNPGRFDSMDGLMLQILNQLRGEGEGRLYLDYTGGLRTASMLLLFFARLSESFGIRVQQVLYSKKDGACGKIEDHTETYRLFDWLDAMSAKNPAALKKIVKKKAKYPKTEKLFSDLEGVILRENRGDYGLPFALPAADEDEPDGIFSEMTNKFLTDEREKHGRKGKMFALIEEGRLKEAVELVRENALEQLIDLGYLIWKASPEATGQLGPGSAFVAYLIYYRKYLEFAENLLKELAKCADVQAMNARYSAYMEDKKRLRPADRTGNVKITGAMRREFKIREPELSRQLEQQPDERLKERYIKAYIQTGFPFANVYNDFTYSRCGKIWYGDKYLNSLENVVRKLLNSSDERVREQLEMLLRDRRQLAKRFPPVHLPALFDLRGGDFVGFADKALLIDSLRYNRNFLVHKEREVTQSEADDINRNLREYAAWLKGL